MQDTKELIARIRDAYPKFIAFTDIPHIASEAADAIEALQAEVDRLAHQLNRQKQWKDTMRDKMQALQAQLAAAQGQEPLGWKLVPVEPTPEMLEAAVDGFFAEVKPHKRKVASMIKLPEPEVLDESDYYKFYTEAQLKQAVRDALEQCATLCARNAQNTSADEIRALIKEVE